MIRRPPISPLSPSTTLSRPPAVGTPLAEQPESTPQLSGCGVELVAGVVVARHDHHVAGFVLNDGVMPEADRAPRGVGRIAKHLDRKSTRLNSSHSQISYAVF